MRFLLLTTPISAATIRDDLGGLTFLYMMQVDRYKQSGEEVRIFGECGSGCTLYLSLSNICMGPETKFMFHVTRRWPIGDAEHSFPDPEFTQWLVNRYYPDWVKQWITKQGGLTEEVLTMPSSYAGKFIRNCSR